MVWQPQTTQLEAVGTSRAQQSIVLFPEVAGLVEAVLFTPGQRVETGQTLLKLEAEDERLAVEAAQLELEDAERLLSRYRQTKSAGAVTAATLEEAQTAVARARINLARAEVALEEHSINAPFAGWVGLTDIDVGAHVDPSTPITSLDDRKLLWVTFSLPEIYYEQLQPGMAVAVSPWTHGSDILSARLVHVDSRIDAQTRAFTARLALDNSADALRPGMSFRVRLDLIGGLYPLVPEVALQWGGDGAYVWALEDGRSTRVAATVVERQQGAVLLKADLPEGTEVIVEGLQGLREGATVEYYREDVAEDGA